jgi:hypothetical protein
MTRRMSHQRLRRCGWRRLDSIVDRGLNNFDVDIAIAIDRGVTLVY